MTVLADGGRDAGLGHLARCSAIAGELRRLGHRTATLALGADAARELDGSRWEPLDPGAPAGGPEAPGGPAPAGRLAAPSGSAPAGGPGQAAPTADVLLLDSYRDDREAVAAAVPHRVLAAMHDGGEPPARARLLAGVAPIEPRPGVEVLDGLEHACLRAAYRDAPEPEVAASVASVLVTAGGGTASEQAVAIAAGLHAALADAAVRVVVPRGAGWTLPGGVEAIDAPTTLYEHLGAADLVVTAAGQTLLEALALGRPAVAFAAAPNQEPQAALVRGRRLAAVVAGPGDAIGAAVALAGDATERLRLARAGQAAVDGRGAERVARRLAQLV